MFIKLLMFIPKNLVSFFIGYLMRIAFPRAVFAPIASLFIKTFKIDMMEASKDLGAYRTLEEIFTRELKTSARIFDGPICSPADGVLVISQLSENGTAVQCKGVTYSLQELISGSSLPVIKTDIKWFTTIYLAPHNYHRVHSPCCGVLSSIRYIPGQLWPVNKLAVKWIPQLFLKNERLIFEIEVDGGGVIFVVMVGALNVGRIETLFVSNFCTNSISRQIDSSSKEFYFNPKIKVALGQELGVFMLGSTVIMAFDGLSSKRFKIRPFDGEHTIMVGESLSSRN